jgi:hypothetical protein
MTLTTNVEGGAPATPDSRELAPPVVEAAVPGGKGFITGRLRGQEKRLLSWALNVGR